MLRLLLIGVFLAHGSIVGAQTSRPLGASDAQLRITAVKSRVLVGEFTKIRTEWLARRGIVAGFGGEQVQIDDGTGFREHVEASGEDIVPGECAELAAGGSRLLEHTIGLRSVPERQNQPLAFVFDKPGVYRVKLTYDDVQSNVIEIEAVTPSGRDAELFEAIRADPVLLSRFVMTSRPARWARLAELIEQYGGHPYLVPMIGYVYPGDDRESYDKRVKLVVDRSAFAPDEALWLARLGPVLEPPFRPGDAERADRRRMAALRQVIRRFPGRLAAVQAAQELRDAMVKPPQITAEAYWARRWQEKHGDLERVYVGWGAQLPRGQSRPVLVLASITCDDGCDPVADIHNADIGTSDFQFDLRFKRTEGGTGRVYTITYRSTDPSGSVIRVVSRLRVPRQPWVVAAPRCGG